MSFVYFLLGLTLLGLFFWYFATEIEKKKRLIGSILVSAVAVLAFFAVTPPKEKLKGGIDIVGGTSVTVRILDEPFILVRGKNLKDNEAQIDSSKRDAVLSQVREIAAKHLPDADNNDIATNGPNGILIVSPEISKANFELLKKELTTSLREVTRNNLQNQSETNPALLWKITSDLDPDAAKDTILTAEAMENVKTIIGNRVNPGGTKDISLYSLGLNRVVVEAPGLEKEERDTIRKQIEQQATLELRAVLKKSSDTAFTKCSSKMMKRARPRKTKTATTSLATFFSKKAAPLSKVDTSPTPSLTMAAMALSPSALMKTAAIACSTSPAR